MRVILTENNNDNKQVKESMKGGEKEEGRVKEG